MFKKPYQCKVRAKPKTVFYNYECMRSRSASLCEISDKADIAIAVLGMLSGNAIAFSELIKKHFLKLYLEKGLRPDEA